MTLESAVQAILEMGKAEASQILEEARAERERTLSQVRTEAAAALAETEKGAREEAERRRIQGLARAELESRKIVLAAQREALDRVYEGALARLSHPHIVTVHDFGQADGLYYLLMEYVNGVNLRQLLRAGQLQPAEALKIVPQVCEALQFAHDEGWCIATSSRRTSCWTARAG